ncbi:MAG: hypothetical protein IJF78_12735 [Clostridia bacterium]|nr:hypothetical protein [Clostridia bacterium]
MRSELIGGCADECDEDAAQLMKRMRTENTLKNLTIFINVMTIMIELCTIVQVVKKISGNKNNK